MVEINITQLILIAFVSGLGGGLGNPIGQFFFEKYLKPKMEALHKINSNIKTTVFDKTVNNIKKMDEDIQNNIKK
jgi:hypothetical protein